MADISKIKLPSGTTYDIKDSVARETKIDKPSTEGTSGQVLSTDGNGGTAWADQPDVITGIHVGETAPTDPNVQVWLQPDGESDVVGIEAEATQLPAGSSPTAEFDATGNVLTLQLGLPAPEKGDRGDTVIIATKYEDLTFPVAEGTYCLYNNLPYVANQAIATSEAWTAAHWDQVSFEDEIGELKSAINNFKGGTLGQILRKKSNTDYDIEWANIGAPTDVQVETAVDTWLDEHPEATTTVQDGSVTEQKLYPDTLLKLENGYVTPEMFGAKGDGITDDTVSIKAMLASGARFIWFDKPSYKITDSIDFTIDYMTVRFSNTEIIAVSNGEKLEYAIGFKAALMETIGQLRVTCARQAYICIYIDQAHGSFFDSIIVSGAIIWGVYVNHKNSRNNTMTFESIRAMSCGVVIPAKGKVNSENNNNLDITDLDYSYYSYLQNQEKEHLFNGEYSQTNFIVDDSDYQINPFDSKKRLIFGTSIDKSITLNEADYSVATFDEGTIRVIPSDYEDSGEGRRIVIPVGGGISFCSAASEGGLKIGRLSITTCATAFYCNFPYGFYVDALMVESCTLMLAVKNVIWCGYIGYIYYEGLGLFLQSNSNKDTILVCKDGNTRINIGTSLGNISSQRQTIIGGQTTSISSTALLPSLQSIGSRARCINGTGGKNIFITLNEESPNNIIYNATELSNSATSVVLEVLYADSIEQSITGFPPKHIYIHNTSDSNKMLNIGINSNTLAAGYNINGAVNNLYSIDSTKYGKRFKVTVLLLGKTFYIEVEKLYADYAEKTDLPVSVLSPTESELALQPYPTTYSFGEKAELNVTVTSDSQYRFMFKSPAGAACNLTINGIAGTSGDAVLPGKTYVVDIWAGVAVIKEMSISWTELYPVGTDITDFYNFKSTALAGYTINTTTGEIENTSSSTEFTSENYAEIDPSYTYKKKFYRLYTIAYYDENLNYIGYTSAGNNTTDEYEITGIPQNAKYVRIAMFMPSSQSYYTSVGLVRSEG